MSFRNNLARSAPPNSDLDIVFCKVCTFFNYVGIISTTKGIGTLSHVKSWEMGTFSNTRNLNHK